jgi:tetratricopeptide (TPR) repeat protein
MRAPAVWLLAGLLALAASADSWGLESTPSTPQTREAARARHARRSLEDARLFRREGRLDPAERALRRGLAASPEDARLHRELARLLIDLGRPEEAARARRRGDSLEPPPPPPPETPLATPSRGVLVALLPPEPSGEHPLAVAARAPDGAVAATLERRLRTRLPEATLLHAAPESVAAARAWLTRRAPRAVLSLRIDRAHCGESVKDGRFALARLRVAAATPAEPGSGPEWSREVLLDPQLPDGCETLALSLALERALELPAVAAALRAPQASSSTWSRRALRDLFPNLGLRITQELRSGRRLLASGHAAEALEVFRRAERVDAEDPNVRAFLAEAEAILELSRDLAQRRGGDTLEPLFTPAERAVAEARLAEEQRLREALLAALAVLGEDRHLPPARLLAALHASEIPDLQAFGPRLAGTLSAGALEARGAYAPDGSAVARYSFAVGAELPVLREEDTDGDDRPDRWIVYTEGSRREIWEDGRRRGRPDVHLLFARGGDPLERIELDADADGRPERVFHYDPRGALAGEGRDTDGDGRLDRFDRFDADGNLDLREEDLDGDGGVDVRSVYRAGKLVRRELARPELAPNGT